MISNTDFNICPVLPMNYVCLLDDIGWFWIQVIFKVGFLFILALSLHSEDFANISRHLTKCVDI